MPRTCEEKGNADASNKTRSCIRSGEQEDAEKLTHSQRLGSSTSVTSFVKPHLSFTWAHCRCHSTEANGSQIFSLNPIRKKVINKQTFKLLSGPFQHLSPPEKTMTLYDSSNFSHCLNYAQRRFGKFCRTKEPDAANGLHQIITIPGIRMQNLQRNKKNHAKSNHISQTI